MQWSYSPIEHELLLAKRLVSSIDARNDALMDKAFRRRHTLRDSNLRCRFFISSRAVDLASEKQTANLLGLKSVVQLAWVNVIVFDAIACAI